MTPPFEPVPEDTLDAEAMFRRGESFGRLDNVFADYEKELRNNHLYSHIKPTEEDDIVDKEAIDKAMQDAKAEARAKAMQDAEDLDKMVAEASIPNLAALMQQGLDAGHITRQPVYQTKYPISH